MYLMELLSETDFHEYTDYYKSLSEWGSYSDLMVRTSAKIEIAKNYKNHEELYKVIINDYLNNGDDVMLYEIIKDFNEWIVEHNYYDKRIF